MISSQVILEKKDTYFPVTDCCITKHFRRHWLEIIVLICFARESVIWVGLGGNGLSLLLATSAEMAERGLGDPLPRSQPCGEQWIVASAGAVSQDFGFFQCGPLLGFLSAGHLDYKRNIPRDRRWELPISSDLDAEVGTVCLPFYSIGRVVTEPTWIQGEGT